MEKIETGHFTMRVGSDGTTLSHPLPGSLEPSSMSDFLMVDEMSGNSSVSDDDLELPSRRAIVMEAGIVAQVWKNSELDELPMHLQHACIVKAALEVASRIIEDDIMLSEVDDE